MANVQADAGYTKIANKLLEAICHASLSNYESRVFLAIMRLTYGWQKKADKIALSQIAELTGIDRSHVAHSVKRLSSRNMISRNGVTGIQKDFDKWVLLIQAVPKSATLKIKVLPESAPKVLPESAPKVLPESAPTKETIKERKKEGVRTEYQMAVDFFCVMYESMIGTKYCTVDFHFSSITKKVKQFGYDVTINKIKTLALLCQEGQVWPFKEGPACFTIETLIQHWNRIVRVEKMDEETIKSIRVVNNLRKKRGEDELPISAFTGTGSKPVASKALCSSGPAVIGTEARIVDRGAVQNGLCFHEHGEGADIDDEFGHQES